MRAARRERDDLLVHRRRLATDRDRLLDQVRHLDDSMAGLEERLTSLNEILGEAEPERDDRDERPADQRPADEWRSEVEPGHVLTGPAIREMAVQVVLQQPEYIEALHYRRWYALITEAGYAVSGKDPLAVFLTQLTRSPVIRKSTEAGVYELDRQAPLRLRQRLERLNAELRELRSPASTEPGAENARARRHDLNVAIGQTERALDEALRVLRRDPRPQAQPGSAEALESRR